ncbi:NAD-dependent epimerase/dehydratase family protein [Corynebacterium heidelbergense]|uniref:NAD-dependent epimerase/dehydratase domain-containing protein n=1 Tax=Corynebacterium heidelbergense TaxID=2055947 RepID=A0A364V886_9CORY|nr:NAD-dependent epimerase/dehydratase family protein [Corynebacterium heidelbergense]RAV32851.1 hypothetical protein DLJ54_01300 [Corynebacterium heidelbergense]
MRVVVTGASGNAGTGVLRALAETPEVTSVLGIARRLPNPTVHPYSTCEWASIDIGAQNSPTAARTALEQAFSGADAVIHLAWLIQPNRDRDLLRRVNVEGAKTVAQAAAAAGVKQLVVASSVGAYSPDAQSPSTNPPSDTDHGIGPNAQPFPLRDETWPTRGIRSSHYSTDKADVESFLDAFEAAHPGIIVTRIRPALIFQSDAGAEIQRYFLGSLFPVQALRAVRLPILPLPANLHVQTVHSNDVGRAYAAAVAHRAGGAFNICADAILTPRDLAKTLSYGRFFRVPAKAVRPLVALAYRAHLNPTDPGWLDMALGAPMMSNAKAKKELGWSPQHEALGTLRELVDGMIAGRGAQSPVLRPR